MKKFIRIQVHSCFAAVSSSDVFLYKDITTEHDPSSIRKQLKTEFSNIKRKDSVYYKRNIVIQFYEDTTFCCTIGNSFIDMHSAPEFISLVDKYQSLGFSLERPHYIERHFELERKKATQLRKKEGYIFCFGNNEYNRERIQGGFSGMIFNHPIIVKYTTNNRPLGFIGHSVRKKELDAYLEKKFMEYPVDIEQEHPAYARKCEIFCTWLTSTDGRHFGNQLEGLTFKKQKDIINRGIENIFNIRLSYILPDHADFFQRIGQNFFGRGRRPPPI